MIQKPIRLRDFIEDIEGRLYAVSAYDNRPKVGCIIRYIPDPDGERENSSGKRFRKLDFEEAYAYISREKPEYADLIQRVPERDVVRVLKPEEEIDSITRRSLHVTRLIRIFNLPKGTFGCTGSYLCGLETEQSDIDLVVYGNTFSHARNALKKAIIEGQLSPISEEIWESIYKKRNPELRRDEFLLHEKRKWNRGQIGQVYFDILFTRSYRALNPVSYRKGTSCGKMTVEAHVTDASLSFDNPAQYHIDHEKISRILSFSHTYSGQALEGELIQAHGVCEEHGGERWLIVGTTRDARGEYIRSLSLLEGA
jgi:predicted nucleotidyltransferase